jgi:tetratricopeptide (TPR) repeat protein
MLTDLPAVDFSLAGQLDLNEAWLKGYQGDFAGAQESCRRARQAARQSKDDRLYARTYGTEATLLADTGKFGKALAAAERAVSLAAPRNDRRLLREAKKCSVLALLYLGKLDRAWTEARFSTEIVQRHGALAANTLKGIVALRRGDDETATSTFDRAHRLATEYLEVEQDIFEVWDLVGLIRCVYGLADRPSYEEKMVDAFQKARGRTSAAGVVHRIQMLIDQVAMTTTSSLPALARRVASGLAV